MTVSDVPITAGKQPELQTATLDSTGAGTAIFSHNLANIRWIIPQLSVDCGGVCSVQVKMNGLPCTSLVTNTSPVTADGDPPVSIGGHDSLTVFITAGPPGGTAVCTAWVQEVPEY